MPFALTREQSQVDRRTVQVRLSPEAVEHIEHCEGQMLEYIVELLEKVGPEWAQRWCEVYARIREVLAADLLQTEARGRSDVA